MVKETANTLKSVLTKENTLSQTQNERKWMFRGAE